MRLKHNSKKGYSIVKRGDKYILYGPANYFVEKFDKHIDAYKVKKEMEGMK